MKKIHFKPAHKVFDAMPHKERERTAALINVRTEPGADENIKFVIDVVFQAVPVKRPFLRGHWFVACRGALVGLQIDDGTILAHTGETLAEFNYKNKDTTGWKFEVELKPSVKLDFGATEAELGGVGATAGKETKHSGEIDHSGEESPLSAAGSQHTVGWKISMVRGDRAISDFIYGNQPLWADWKGEHKRLQGTIKMLPAIFDFDRDERRMGDFRSLLMQLTLAFRGLSGSEGEMAPIRNDKGITLTFGENR